MHLELVIQDCANLQSGKICAVGNGVEVPIYIIDTESRYIMGYAQNVNTERLVGLPKGSCITEAAGRMFLPAPLICILRKEQTRARIFIVQKT